jgi:septal ring factor EnvC (AmiA/AmiB activator)
MIEYTEQAQMVEALRACAEGKCSKCPSEHSGWDCDTDMITKAADMIESRYRQIEELRQKIDEQDEEIAGLKREIDEQDEEIAGLKREIMSYPAEESEWEERCGL